MVLSPPHSYPPCGAYGIYQSEGILERISESPWGRCLQGAVAARWVVVVVCLLLCCCCCCCLLSSSPQWVSFWTNRAEARGQLVLSPVRLPEQLRSSRLVDLAPNFASYLREPATTSTFLLKTDFCICFIKSVPFAIVKVGTLQKHKKR